MNKINKLNAEYLKICPLDKNRANIEEILKFQECLNDYRKFGLNYQKLLLKSKNCQDLRESYFFCKIEKDLFLFKKYFKKTLNYQPFNLQLYWAKKALKGESFSIIAPTGFGKSTFGIIFSLFNIEILKQNKIYYLVPTKILVSEIEKKFNLFNKNKEIKILAIKKPEDKIEISNNNYDILITTTQFLHKNFDLLPKNFNLVYIDDADSMIRQPRNIDKVLQLIGFSNNDIEMTIKIIDSKRKKDYQLSEKLKENINLSNKGKIIIASATLTPRTKRINLFRELLNFEIGNSNTYLRNIVDFYDKVNSKDKLFKKSIEWLKYLKKGGFVFLADDFNKEDLLKYFNYLKKNNIKFISYEKFNSKNIKLFENGEIDVVVGFSNVRNPLTRGIDLPHVIRYAIFLGIPKFKIPLTITYTPRILLMMILTFQQYLEDNNLFKDIKFLKKYSFLNEESILRNQNLKNKIELIQNKLRKLFQDKNFFEKIEKDKNLKVIKENDKFFLLISDPKGYIQASGRTSRLFPLGLTQGLSILLVEDKKIFDNLKNKLKLIGYKINFMNIKECKEEFKKTIELVDKDRELIKKIITEEKILPKDQVKTALIIVESPTKAKTIANFFGKPAKKIYRNFWVYEVSLGNYLINIIATLGHFVDLVYKEGYYGIKKDNQEFLPIFEPLKICLNCQRHIDIDDNICPICNNNNFLNKEFLIEILKNLANNVQEIYLATDPDTEGEKIAFDLFIYLYPYNKNIKRIELHEITKEEFLRRFKQPRKLNLDLVCAQITRRIADRWIGFSLSEKIQKEFKNLNLSAGRVQTPVLGWIISRELERRVNKIYSIRFFFGNQYYDIQTENIDLVKKIRKLKNNLLVRIQFLKSKIEIVSPPPPFQTSDLLKYSWDLLKFDLPTTMSLAQDLFERGLITYHRTDSTYVSNLGKEIAYEFLNKKDKLHLSQKRSWGKPGTHECIRPTKALSVEEVIEQSIINQNELFSNKHLKLYSIILKRFIASQCKAIKIKKTLISFKLISENKVLIEDEKEVITEIIENGFNEIYSYIYPFKIQPGEFVINDLKINRFSKELLYTNASIIDKMKKENLGRPSTYSSIIQTLIERRYIIIKKGYLIPTNQGKNIYNYLNSSFSDIINENFTKELEKKMDAIEKKQLNYQDILAILFKRLFLNENNKF
ncbi:MAG: reverse gyrase 2 [Candidatus Parcubacteria bacterium]|nr:MAG: reverse gyrase 2 [Candidatus Parcubacteria bacterium]